MPLDQPRGILLLPVAFCLVSLLSSAGFAADPGGSELEERWYRVSIGASPAGHMVVRERRGDGTLSTETDLEMTLKRGSFEQSLAMASRFLESLDGRPIEAWSRQAMGAVPTETTYLFDREEILIRRRQGDSKIEERVPLPPDWTTPGRSHALLQEALASGAEELTVRNLDPLLGPEPVETQWRLEAAEASIESGGRNLPTTRWRQSQSALPGVVSIVDLDSTGRMVQTRTPIMGLEMTLTLASREEALGSREAPELLLESFVRPDRPIPRPRAVRRGVYALRLAEDSMPELPSLGDQRTRVEGDRTVVTVELGSSPRIAGELDTAPYLEASLYANFETPELAELGRRALRGAAAEPAARAEALRAFVYSYLEQKDLGSLFATATEVAANRSGDCTEHSVLLMALLRGAGIPARVVSGLIYADRFAGHSEIFGYHMWTQALLDGRWADLDATLPVPFDATHIAFGTTALNDEGDIALDLAEVLQVMGRLEVEVLEIGHGAPAGL